MRYGVVVSRVVVFRVVDSRVVVAGVAVPGVVALEPNGRPTLTHI